MWKKLGYAVHEPPCPEVPPPSTPPMTPAQPIGPPPLQEHLAPPLLPVRPLVILPPPGAPPETPPLPTHVETMSQFQTLVQQLVRVEADAWYGGS